jgi:dTDP-4-amino-4,6-dideoxygalactose transaminase
MIPFNKPYTTNDEITHIAKVIESGKLAGDGSFTFAVQQLMEKRYNFNKSLLTTSCTDALEMSALLANIDSNSEVVMPSYTFVSTANAFVLRGAKIVFADSEKSTPNIDALKIESLITKNTKAIVVVHYAGVSCDMDTIVSLARKYNLILIEDAAQAIDAYYKNRPLGSIGTFGTFSFHETKNIVAGEGGLLVINDSAFNNRAEVIREKGTNRAQFFRGEVDKYGWVEIGSSFLASDITAAFLYAQLTHIDEIQEKRKKIWARYYKQLEIFKKIKPDFLPHLPSYATNNAHIFYITCSDLSERTALSAYLLKNGIKSAFHYLSLHSSMYFQSKHDGRVLPESDRWSECLLRLPLFADLTEVEVDYICEKICNFYNV